MISGPKTVTVAVEELLEVASGASLVQLTVAVLVIGPIDPAFEKAVIVITIFSPAARVPILPLNTFATIEKPGGDEVRVQSNPVGRASVIVAFNASPVPTFVTMIVNPTASPALTSEVFDVFDIDKSGL